jgi:hypothetical protein
VILAELLLQVAIYSRDIAPVLALHCNRCHGDDFSGGGVDTRTYEDLRRTANLGLLLELIEGRRGASQRMPRDAAPLEPAILAKVRQWIEAGAPFDHEPQGEQLRRDIDKKPEIRLVVKAPGHVYLVLEVRDPDGNLVYRDAAVAQDVHRWTLRAARYWTSKVAVVVTVRYASGPASLDILP